MHSGRGALGGSKITCEAAIARRILVAVARPDQNNQSVFTTDTVYKLILQSAD